MVTFAIGIVAHPSRHDRAHELAEQIDADVVCVDYDSNGERWCHQETLRRLIGRADWLVLLEDDALPCPNFRDHLTQALADAPSPVVSLYLGTGRWAGENTYEHEPRVQALIAEADSTNAHWILGRSLWHGVGIAIRSDIAPLVLTAMERLTLPTDEAIGQWCRWSNHPVAYTWPSLVDHDDNERLVASKDTATRRKAFRLLGGRV